LLVVFYNKNGQKQFVERGRAGWGEAFMVRSARFVIAAILALCAFAGQGQAADPIGKVIAVGGSPTSSGRALRAGSPVYENDRLETGGGNVQIIFVDDTKLVVGPNSSLVIDRFLMRGGNRAEKFSVAALRGTFRFISGHSAKSAYDIQTANATIGIRGTAFDFSSGRETLIAVVQGNVRLCAYGDCTSIPEGCGVGRARGNRVGELGGRAKGRALRQLPYIVSQGALAQPFRLNTSSCRGSLSALPTSGHNGNAIGGPAGGSESPAGGSPPSGPGRPGAGRPGGTPGGGSGHGNF
jgi:hypothetical protein